MPLPFFRKNKQPPTNSPSHSLTNAYECHSDSNAPYIITNIRQVQNHPNSYTATITILRDSEHHEFVNSYTIAFQLDSDSSRSLQNGDKSFICRLCNSLATEFETIREEEEGSTSKEVSLGLFTNGIKYDIKREKWSDTDPYSQNPCTITSWEISDDKTGEPIRIDIIEKKYIRAGDHIYVCRIYAPNNPENYQTKYSLPRDDISSRRIAFTTSESLDDTYEQQPNSESLDDTYEQQPNSQSFARGMTKLLSSIDLGSIPCNTITYLGHLNGRQDNYSFSKLDEPLQPPFKNYLINTRTAFRRQINFARIQQQAAHFRASGTPESHVAPGGTSIWPSNDEWSNR